jgi:hypothetical protein
MQSFTHEIVVRCAGRYEQIIVDADKICSRQRVDWKIIESMLIREEFLNLRLNQQ